MFQTYDPISAIEKAICQALCTFSANHITFDTRADLLTSVCMQPYTRIYEPITQKYRVVLIRDEMYVYDVATILNEIFQRNIFNVRSLLTIPQWLILPSDYDGMEDRPLSEPIDDTDIFDDPTSAVREFAPITVDANAASDDSSSGPTLTFAVVQTVDDDEDIIVEDFDGNYIDWDVLSDVEPTPQRVEPTLTDRPTHVDGPRTSTRKPITPIHSESAPSTLPDDYLTIEQDDGYVHSTSSGCTITKMTGQAYQDAMNFIRMI